MLPLLIDRPLERTLAWRGGRAVSAGEFVAESTALAERLPATGQAINLCQDRYHFAVGLAAALLRGHTSLLPPNALPQTLRQLGGGGAPPYALLDDDALDTGALTRWQVGSATGLVPSARASSVPAS